MSNSCPECETNQAAELQAWKDDAISTMRESAEWQMKLHQLMNAQHIGRHGIEGAVLTITELRETVNVLRAALEEIQIGLYSSKEMRIIAKGARDATSALTLAGRERMADSG